MNYIRNKSTAIRTPILPEVYEVIKDIKCDFDAITPYTTSIVEWLKPIVDLSHFYVYPTNGITEGLNWWALQEPRGIHIKPGDYQWVKPSGNDITYQTIPSSIDGNIVDLDPNTVALDLAYVGSTQPFYISNIDNVEYVFYSFSKTFGLRNIRTGWLFTRTKDQRLEDLSKSAKYYNYYAWQVSEAIIANFDHTYVYNRLKPKQVEICLEYNLIPSDTVWLATSTSDEYAHLRRAANVARVSLCNYLVD